MVISPILRGMMGLEVNALNSSVIFAPHVPAGWTDFTIRNVKVGTAQLAFKYHNVGEDITLEVESHGSGNVELQFSPALSLHAKVITADVDGRKISPKIDANENDQHATISVPISTEKATIHLRVNGNFGIAYPYAVPADGAVSSSLRVVSETWNAAHDQLQLQVAGVNGKTCEVPIYNAPSGIAVQGARIVKSPAGLALEIAFPPGPPDAYSTRTITLRFPMR
jgi:hypothetical protein